MGLRSLSRNRLGLRPFGSETVAKRLLRPLPFVSVNLRMTNPLGLLLTSGAAERLGHRH